MTTLQTHLDHYAAAHAFKRARFARQRQIDYPYLADMEASSVAFWRNAARSWRMLAANHRCPTWAAEVNRLLPLDGEIV